MLEKIGLPAKPALRGNSWVVDASHCQGCAAQFTFINRKHHCRRCGGLFCNTCTQQRMVLRGQGDSPVRICDPCKQAEEAAKFERRYGAKSKAGKADPKQGDSILRELLNDGKGILSGQGSLSSLSSVPRSVSSASSSTAQEEPVQDEGKELAHSSSISEFKDVPTDMESVSPEKLRQQAMEEKSKYKILKADGKPGEALKAFKRGKELEREAAALELSLRKNRKKSVPSSSITKADSKMVDTDTNPARSTRKDTNDISAELRELGWSDMELHGADKKTGTMSLEGELSTLIGETFQNSKASKGSSVTDKSEVIAMKRKALALKREGKMAEAKEELKKAKILEKELEEQELLAEADDSDDEFASLIKSMGTDKPDDVLIADVQVPALDIDQLMRMADDIGEDGEVTDADLNDPEISAALQSFGWSEDASPPENLKPRAEPMDRESLLEQVQSLKREALNNKRAGNTAEAMSLLKKAKLLERELDAMQVNTSEMFLNPNKEIAAEKFVTPTVEQYRPPLKSKMVIQRELLAVKKKALSLRREGKLDEAEDELKKAKILEQQLEEIGKESVSQVITHIKEPDLSSIMDIDGKGGEEDVTESDLYDPTYLSLLSNLGWKDDDAESTSTSLQPPLPNRNSAEPVIDTPIVPESVRKPVALPRRSKAELQRELLGLKRNALTLRRQGRNEEAEEVLNSAKSLEEQLAEMEVPKKLPQAETAAPLQSLSMEVLHETMVEKDAKIATTPQPKEIPQNIEVEAIIQPSATTSVTTNSTNVSSTIQKDKTIANGASPPLSSRDRFKLQQKSLSHKRQALKLRREGRTEEADAEFQLAKEIENQLEGSASQSSSESSSTNVGMVEDLLDPQLMSALKSIGITDANPSPQCQAKAEPPNPVLTQPNKLTPSSSQERTELEQQIKAEKIKAVTLKREGKQAEALNTLRHAKMLEKKLNLLPS